MRLVTWPKIDVKKWQNLIFKVHFNVKNPLNLSKKKSRWKISIKEQLFCFYQFCLASTINNFCFYFFFKFTFFDSYFGPFNKTHEKIIAIFVISAIMVLICNVFIKFCWHDEKFTPARLSGWTEFNAKVLTYIIFFKD